MQRWKRVIGTGISLIYGVKRIFSETPQGLRILMYHSIESIDSGDLGNLYCVSAHRFRSHLEYVKTQQGNPQFAVQPFVTQASSGISFTFDDGYRDNLEVAAPLLLEYGFPFHVFVNPSFVMSGESKYLTTRSLRELANTPGVSIGAHGFSHRRLTECTTSELEYELDASKQWIEDIIGRQVTTMAYPHGAMNNEVRQATARAGYTLAASSKFGIASKASDCLALERTDIWSTDTDPTFRSKLNGNWDWMRSRT